MLDKLKLLLGLLPAGLADLKASLLTLKGKLLGGAYLLALLLFGHGGLLLGLLGLLGLLLAGAALLVLLDKSQHTT